MDDRILCNNAVFCRVRLNHLELHRPHASAHEESITLAHGTICYGFHKLLHTLQYRKQNIPSRKYGLR